MTESKVCEGDIVTAKNECVNHVSKRMGTALNHLKDECKVQGQSITGKGKLTNQMIIKIQKYYGHAIKDNENDINRRKLLATNAYNQLKYIFESKKTSREVKPKLSFSVRQGKPNFLSHYRANSIRKGRFGSWYLKSEQSLE